LDVPDPGRRVEAAFLIGEFGKAARAASWPLQSALGDLSGLVRVQAAAALAKIDPENARALAVLMAALESTDLDVLDPAISAIANFGSIREHRPGRRTDFGSETLAFLE